MKARKLFDLLAFRKNRSKEAQKLAQYGLWEESEIANREIIERLPGDYVAHSQLADALMRLERQGEASDHYGLAISLERTKAERIRKSVEFATESSWIDAVATNQLIIEDCPWDIEAFNRLGKAFTELGKNKDATDAFECALVISPNSIIAKKNLSRLEKVPRSKGSPTLKTNTGTSTYIEERGKTGVTKLVDIPPNSDLSNLIVGHSVDIVPSGRGIRVKDQSGSDIGSVEPKLGARLHRLIKGGNRYDASITSVLDDGASVIIRETHRDPSQANIPSFTAKVIGLPIIPNGSIGYTLNDTSKLSDLKDWSSDDTETGDEDIFSPALPRIISGDSSIDDDEY